MDNVILGGKAWQESLLEGTVRKSGQALPKGFSNWVIVSIPSGAVEVIFFWLHSQI